MSQPERRRRGKQRAGVKCVVGTAHRAWLTRNFAALAPAVRGAALDLSGQGLKRCRGEGQVKKVGWDSKTVRQ